MSTFRTVALAAVRAAGAQLHRRFHRLTPSDIRRKGAHDIVTRADDEANTLIIRAIRKHFPGHQILSEETGRQGIASSYRWVVDPLDGTLNFTIGNPLFCTALALVHGDQVELGIIYAPALGELYVAERGRGATCNGRRIRTSAVSRMRDAVVLIGRSHDVRSHRRSFLLQERLERRAMSGRQIGSDSLCFAFTAAGRVAATVLVPPGISAWDAAAGTLLVQEAGGAVLNFRGRAWSPGDDGIIACTKKIQRQLVASL
ncbi:MAG: inositol monophosphatase [Patescibacteria group bacterium]